MKRQTLTGGTAVCARPAVDGGGAQELPHRPQEAWQGAPAQTAVTTVCCAAAGKHLNLIRQLCRATGGASRGTTCRRARPPRWPATRRSTTSGSSTCTTASGDPRCLTWRRKQTRCAPVKSEQEAARTAATGADEGVGPYHAQVSDSLAASEGASHPRDSLRQQGSSLHSAPPQVASRAPAVAPDSACDLRNVPHRTAGEDSR